MPVQQTRGHAGKALLVAGLGVVVALAVALLVAQAATRGDVTVRLGDDEFDAGQVAAIAESIEEGDGLPLLYQDVADGDRHIFVQHLGDDIDEGWVAFSAFDPDRPECLVEIDREAAELVNECTGETYPRDGSGLRFYETRVDGGDLFVFLNEPIE